MKTSYNIYQVTFDIWLGFMPSVTETLAGKPSKYDAIKHVKPTCWMSHSGYTYKERCKLVGRVTNIRLKPKYVDKLRRNMNDIGNTIIYAMNIISI